MTPAPGADRRPTWTVQSVFDPDGGGHDFAYTVGLDELALPELHLWGRPSLGEDPADWVPCPRLDDDAATLMLRSATFLG